MARHRLVLSLRTFVNRQLATGARFKRLVAVKLHTRDAVQTVQCLPSRVYVDVSREQLVAEHLREIAVEAGRAQEVGEAELVVDGERIATVVDDKVDAPVWALSERSAGEFYALPWAAAI